MLTKRLAFEQDKTAIFLRNQEMHLHFSKLDSIQNRKNTYLPQISPIKNNKITNKNKSKLNIFKNNDFFVERDNKLIYKKLDKIFKRPHKINNDSEIIDGYLNEKKYARIKCHEIKKDLLLKENELFKKRIYNTKPVIDNKAFDNEFKKYRKISGYLRKIHPCESSNNIYLNRKESQIIREYEKEKKDYYKEKEAKEKSFSTNKYAFLSINSSRVNSNMNYSREKNKKKDVPFKINKKILRKIKNV